MRYAVWTLGADECRPPLSRGMVVAARFDWHDRAIDDIRVVAAKGRAVACSLVQFGRSALALYMLPLPDATRGQDMAKARSRFALRRPDEQPFGNTVHGPILNEIEKAGSAVAVGRSLPFRPLEIGLIVFLGGSQTEPLAACAPRREEQHLIMTDRFRTIHSMKAGLVALSPVVSAEAGVTRRTSASTQESYCGSQYDNALRPMSMAIHRYRQQPSRVHSVAALVRLG